MKCRVIFTIALAAFSLAWTDTTSAQEYTVPVFDQENPFAEPAGGNQALFLDDFGVTEQEPNPNVFVGIVTDVVMKEDTEYVIEAAIGNGVGETLADQSIQFWSTADEIGGDSYGHIVQSFTGYAPSWDNTPDDGEWVTNRATYITPLEGDVCVENECVGEKLTILLSNYAWPPDGEVFGRVFYDNIRVLEEGVEVWKEDFEGTPTPLAPGEVVSPETLGWHRMISPGRDGVNAEEDAGDIIDGKYGIFAPATPGAGVPGDFNGDGNLDAADIDELSTVARNGSNEPRFDLNDDSRVDAADRQVWVEQLKNTYFGDANLDGLFNTSDLVAVFSAGEYEDPEARNSTWAEGDFNGDSEFNTGDLVTAFAGGGFEMGPRGPAAAVPEPNSIVLLCLGFCVFHARLRKSIQRC
ncbi:MAG: hypothetical protein P8N76_26405 [Pirellulaceae bacterium]|nr:hypothetical protein [Pirellulaceae bacterium]